MKHHLEDYYSSIDFEAIDKEIMTDEAAEQARANEQAGVRGEEEGEGPENVLVDPMFEPFLLIALVFGLMLVHVLTSFFSEDIIFFFLSTNN